MYKQAVIQYIQCFHTVMYINKFKQRNATMFHINWIQTTYPVHWKLVNCRSENL